MVFYRSNFLGGFLNSFVFLSLHSKASGLTASVPAGRVIETLSQSERWIATSNLYFKDLGHERYLTDLDQLPCM